jgi:hypothetical protein
VVVTTGREPQRAYGRVSVGDLRHRASGPWHPRWSIRHAAVVAAVPARTSEPIPEAIEGITGVNFDSHRGTSR